MVDDGKAQDYSLVWTPRGYTWEKDGDNITVAWRPGAGLAPPTYLTLARRKGSKEIETVPGTPLLEVAPRLDADFTNRLLISGPSGAGKSHFAGKWINTFEDWLGPLDVFLFSKVASDKAFEDLDDVMERVDVHSLHDDPIAVEDLLGSVAIFDDVDTIADPGDRKAVQQLRGDVLETGRHQRCTCVAINHMITNGAETRKMLSEATAAVLFPRSGSKYHTRRYLREYCGLETPIIRKIMDLPSRWVYIARTYPNYVVHERGAFLL